MERLVQIQYRAGGETQCTKEQQIGIELHGWPFNLGRSSLKSAFFLLLTLNIVLKTPTDIRVVVQMGFMVFFVVIVSYPLLLPALPFLHPCSLCILYSHHHHHSHQMLPPPLHPSTSTYSFRISTNPPYLYDSRLNLHQACYCCTNFLMTLAYLLTCFLARSQSQKTILFCSSLLLTSYVLSKQGWRYGEYRFLIFTYTYCNANLNSCWDKWDNVVR